MCFTRYNLTDLLYRVPQVLSTGASPGFLYSNALLDLHQSRVMFLFASQVVVNDDVMFDKLSHSDNTHVDRHIFPDGGLTPKHRVPCPVSLQDMR